MLMALHAILNRFSKSPAMKEAEHA